MAGLTHGPRDVGGLLDHWVAATPDRPFLTWAPFDEPSSTWTWAEFARDVAGLVASFGRAGVRSGDRVALVLPNHPGFLLAWTALCRLGAVAVCLNPRGSVDELGYVADHSSPVGAVVSPESAGTVASAMPDLRWIATAGSEEGADSLERWARVEPGMPGPPVERSAAAAVQYTSGTTARPKGVVWTQANCLWAGRVGAAHQLLEPRDVNLVHLPLFHTNALSYSFLSSLWSGGRVVLQPRFSASRFWDVSVAHQVTWTSVVSFCLRALAGREVPERHAYRGWASSACLEPSALTGGVPVMGWYGMTETVSHPIVGDIGHLDAPGTMGRPAPEYGIAVVDTEGRPVRPGEAGELRVRGTRGVSLFQEYLHAPEATAAAYTHDGWFLTGDRVRLEESGALSFVERDKDVLKVGGENIGAPEIERVLLAVEGVREAAVVGRPDPMLGEVPVAFVTAVPGAELSPARLSERCAAMLAAFKVPREVRVVDELPRATLDKVAKARLRDLLVAESADA